MVQLTESPIGGDLRIGEIRFDQHFYDKTGRDWNIRLTPVTQLRLESFKLGDTDAAQFPYIITPIKDTYNRAVQALHEASDEAHQTKHGILVLGESNAGKTRLILEALRATLPSWSVSRWRPDYTKDDIPPVEFLTGKRIVLFIDDLQDYTLAQTRDVTSQFLIADPRTMMLRTLVETLLQAAQRAIIVSTCRTENQLQAQAALGWLFVQLMEVSIPSFSPNTQDSKAAQTIAEFQKRGPIHIEDWDGTLGSLVLGLSTKNNQYLALPPPATKVLRAMKLLNLANTTVHTEHRLRAVCVGVFVEKRLLQDEQIWQEAVSLLIQIQFVKEELDQSKWETTLTIRKDTYFEKVVIDYPHRPSQLARDFLQLRKVLIELNDTQALLKLSSSFMFSTFSNLFEATSPSSKFPDLFKEAIPALYHTLALEPNNAEAWFSMGLALFGAPSKFEEAVEAFDHTLALDPNHYFAWRLKSSSLKALGRHEEAIEALEHVLALKHDDVVDWYDKGYSLYMLQRYEEAVEAFDHVLALEPDDATTWLHKGASLEFLGQSEEAVVAFDHALALDSNNAEAWSRKGGSLHFLGREEEAVDAFDHTLALDPNNAAVWSYKGAPLYSLGKYQEALEAFDHALSLKPDNAVASVTWRLKGSSLGALERVEEAVEAFDHALTLDPNNAAAWYGKGLSLSTLQRYEEAVVALDHSLALAPNNAGAWFRKGFALHNLDRYEEAIVTFDHVLALEADNVESWYNKGTSLYNLEQYEEAIEAFDRALALDPNNPDAWQGKADALRGIGLEKDARKAEKQAKKLNR